MIAAGEPKSSADATCFFPDCNDVRRDWWIDDDGSTMSAGGLSAAELLSLAITLLPPSSSSSSSSERSLENPIEALALLIHSIQSSTGFRLVSPSTDAAATATSTTVAGEAEAPSVQAAANQLKDGWKRGGSPAFTYRHDQSSLEFQIKVIEVGGRGMVIGVAVQVSTLLRPTLHLLLHDHDADRGDSMRLTGQQVDDVRPLAHRLLLSCCLPLRPRQRRIPFVFAESFAPSLYPCYSSHRLDLALSTQHPAEAHPWLAQGRIL